MYVSHLIFILYFPRACRALGVQEYELFETVDLFEEKDMTTVLTCLHALGRTIQVNMWNIL